MKKALAALILVLLALLAFCISRQEKNDKKLVGLSNAVEANVPVNLAPQVKTALAAEKSTSNGNLQTIQTNLAAPQGESLNALTATNLEQWKSLIKGLSISDKFSDMEIWVMEQSSRETGVPILLEHDGKKVLYHTRFVDVSAGLPDENVQRVEMKSPIMNINETRELGLQLCELLGVDSKDFLAWCDKVGNHWLDAPSFNTGNYQCGFGIHMTYDDDKPWYINFVIVNRDK